LESLCKILADRRSNGFPELVDALAGFFPELLFIAGLRLMMVKVPYRPTSQNATNSRSGERLIHVACTIRERFGVPQKSKPATFSIPSQR
jgi:hypothetical protein